MSATQYYVAGRFSAFAALPPATGNLLLSRRNA